MLAKIVIVNLMDIKQNKSKGNKNKDKLFLT